MTDELVAYLLDDLCPDRKAEVERRLQSDAAWQREYKRLKECFGSPCDGVQAADEPPKDLVTRTCCLVTRVDLDAAVSHGNNSCGGNVGGTRSVAAAAFVSAPTCSGPLANWSLADLSVGGGVLLLLGMLVVPALHESRDSARRLACQNNLKTLGAAMFEYQQNHGRWLPPQTPGHSAGEFAPALADHVGISRAQLAQLMVCPDSELADRISRGEVKVVIPSQRELEKVFGEERARLIRSMAGDYAYRSGYRDDHNVYHFVKFKGDAYEPMMADAPSLSTRGVRTTNHGGCGQNVLGEDLDVRFRANAELAASLDNIFLNTMGEHAAGCSSDDVVLIRGDWGPDGPAFQPEMMTPAAVGLR